MYVVVRGDLPFPHKVVQATHAGMAATAAFWGPTPRTHPNLVLCEVPDEPELTRLFERLKRQGVPVCEWREDDMAMSCTAIATAPLAGDQRKPLKRLRLMR